MAGSFPVQLKRLFIKNVLVKKRMKRQTIFEMLFPVYMTGILCLIFLAVSSTISPAQTGFIPADLYSHLPAPPYLILTSPETANAQKIMKEFSDNLNSSLSNHLQVKSFKSSESLVSYYNLHQDEIWAGIVFNTENTTGDIDLKNVSYSIRIKQTSDSILPGQASVPATDKMSASLDQCHGGFFNESCSMALYLKSGFLALQNTLDEAIVKLNDDSMTLVTDMFEPMPMQKYVSDTSETMRPVAVMFLIMCFSPLIQYLMVNVVAEKEKGIKEGMSLMGMKPLAYWLSWLLIYAVTTLVPSILMAVVVTYGGVFVNSNIIPVALLFYVFGLSIVCMAFMITPFFSSGKVAGIAGSLSTTIFSLIVYGLKPDTLSVTGEWLVGLICPCAASIGFQRALELDATIGFNFSTLNNGGFSPLSCIIVCLVDAVIYIIIAYILDLALMGDGPFARDGFFGRKFYKRGKFSSKMAKSSDAAVLDGEREVQDHSSSDRPAIEIHNVSKHYEKQDRPALLNVSLSLYQGQIFALLGHNGAGKTTLHRIITGLMQPTEGLVKVFGNDLANTASRTKVRSEMGVCPQHDILFEQLTVMEHLTLYAGIKGVPPTQLENEVEKLLKEIDLYAKRNEFSTNLSGGQKRKLSVGIALIADPRVLLLDEPSSGMDPYSRRKLWNLLQKYRHGRITLLTTHYMQEADVLADSKAVMSRGQVQCVGSSIFLKRTFGVGYHLNLDLESSASRSKVENHVREFCQHEIEPELSGLELSIPIPSKHLPRMSELLNTLSEKKHDLGVRSFGVAMTSLEEVFLQLQKKEELIEAQLEADAMEQSTTNKSKKKTKGLSVQLDEDEKHLIDQTESLPLISEIEKGPQAPEHVSTALQVKLLMWCRALQMLRAPAVFFFMIFMPIILMTISLTVFHSPSTTFTQPPVLPLNMSIYETDDSLNVPYTGYPRDDYLKALSELKNINWTLTKFDGSLTGKDGLLFQNASNFTAAFEFGSDLQVMLLNATRPHSLPSLMAASHAAQMQQKYGGYVSVSSHPFAYASDSAVFDLNSFYAVLLLGMGVSAIPGGFAIDIVRTRASKMKHQLIMAGVHPFIYWIGFMCFDLILFSIPTAYGLILAQILKVSALMGPGAVFYIIAAILYLFVGILFSYVISFLFKDPEVIQSTWPPLQNFIAFIPYIVVSTIDGTTSHNIASILHWVFCCIDPPYTFMSVLYFLFQLDVERRALALIGQKVTFEDYTHNRDLNITLILMFVHIILLSSIIAIIEMRHKFRRRPRESSISSNDRPDLIQDADIQRESELSETQRNNDVRVVHLRKVFPARNHKATKSCQSCHQSSQQEIDEDIDIGLENTRYSADKKSFVAVEDLSFCAEKGTVFGLLGPNGAGKTTTLSILCGEEDSTNGDAYITQHSLRYDKTRAFLNMGYCPQFSALFVNMTVKEHLVLFSRLRGFSVPASNHSAVEKMLMFDIEEYADMRSKNLSGGTQRKLSTAMSISGNPRVVLLDEPSTGMDPGSRRKLWQVIKSSMNDKTALLTTHSMEEAEALCGKIAILVCGRLRCVGSAQHLKSRFGTGYIVEMKLNQASPPDLSEGPLKGCQLLESFGTYFKYSTDLKENHLAEVFGYLSELKDSGVIAEYGLSQCTLEQVFLTFAKEQEFENDVQAASSTV